jgi:putative integral membrane protein (TIGR02587 family)
MRGVAGGLIFGIPVLFTMEVWFDGQTFSPGELFLLLVSSLVLNIFFSYFAGLREKNSSARFFFAIDDGVTSLGLGLVLSFVVLCLIGQVDFSNHFRTELGKVVGEATIISIGVTFTNFKFNKKESKSLTVKNLTDIHPISPERKQSQQDISDLLAATVGALVFSFNVAPTEEITLIASNLGYLELGILLTAELIFAFIVLYASGLKDHVTYTKNNFFQGPLNETLITVTVSLIVSSLMVLTLGYSNLSVTDPLFISSTIVLGFPAAIGASAGRLTI